MTHHDKSRSCETCDYKSGNECRHPQAVNVWGRLEGMRNNLPYIGWPRYPAAKAWCGFWYPTAEWLSEKMRAAYRNKGTRI